MDLISVFLSVSNSKHKTLLGGQQSNNQSSGNVQIHPNQVLDLSSGCMEYRTVSPHHRYVVEKIVIFSLKRVVVDRGEEWGWNTKKKCLNTGKYIIILLISLFSKF